MGRLKHRLGEHLSVDSKSIHAFIIGEHGIDGVVLSMPCIVGKDGIETKVPIRLNDTETEQLRSSAAVLKSIVDGLDI